jgi:WD40 repeat protein
MPAHDRQREPKEAGLAADPSDNPLHEVPGDGVDGSRDPPSALREVQSTAGIYDAIFLGADALAVLYAKKVTLHSLTDEAAAAVLLVDHSAGATMQSITVSRDCAVLCLGDNGGWLAVFDAARLRAEPRSPPRQEARLGAGIAGVAFSDDGARLLTMCIFGPVEVRDVWGEGLPLLRKLAFRGPQHSSGPVLFCAGDLAVAVGGGSYSIVPGAESRRARVWQLGVADEKEAATLELTAFTSAAAVRSDGGQVAVGGADGAVRLFEGEDWEQSAELAELDDDTIVGTLAYTPNGLRLVVGRRSGTFVVYDVGSGAAIGRFVEPNSGGWVAVVARDGDVAAVGGFDSKLVTLRKLAPPVPLHRWAMDGAATGDTLAGAAAVGDVVALGAGSRLEVHSRGGMGPTLALELDAAIGGLTDINNPVAVRPGGVHVACVLGMGKVVTCRALPSGAETFALDRSHLGGGAFGVCWSPGGDLLVAYGSFGSAVFDATGAKLLVLSDDGQFVCSAAFSADGARLATVSNKIFVRDAATWAVTHALPLGGAGCSPCFDLAGEFVAAWALDGPSAGSVVVHRLDGGATPHRFPGINGQGGLAFSANGRFLFAAGAAGANSQYPGYDRVVALSRATGTEADWSVALAAMALPPGTLNGLTLAVPAEGAAATTRLQIAVGLEFVEVDVNLTRRAIDDRAWGYAQLVQLAAIAGPAAVGDLMSCAPHCLNIRDTTTGDTLLHHCANTGNTALAAACLGSEGAVFVPIANADGKTALHMALERREQPLVRVMAASLTPDVADTTAALLTDILRTAALAMPEVVLSLLHTIEATVLVEHATVRTLYHRAEVIGLLEPALTPLDVELKDPEPFESERAEDLESAAGLDLAPWGGAFPSVDKNANHALVAFKTLMLLGLAGDPGDTSGGGAFRAIVDNCDASVFESRLLQHVIQYKFENNVLPMLQRAVLVSSGAILLATAATLASARQLEAGLDSNWVYIDVAQGLMAAAELAQLLTEARQLARQDVKRYFSSPWNLMDVGASIALIIGAVGTFQRSAETVHLFGGLGVALKWFSAARGSALITLCPRRGDDFCGRTYILLRDLSSRCANGWTAAQSSGSNI